MAIISLLLKFMLIVVLIGGICYIFIPSKDRPAIRQKIFLGLFGYIVVMVVITILLFAFQMQYQRVPTPMEEMALIIVGAIGATILSSTIGILLWQRFD